MHSWSEVGIHLVLVGLVVLLGLTIHPGHAGVLLRGLLLGVHVQIDVRDEAFWLLLLLRWLLELVLWERICWLRSSAERVVPDAI